jgi:hypothetical protein
LMSRKPLQLSLDDLNRKVGERLIWQEENQQRRTAGLSCREVRRRCARPSCGEHVVADQAWFADFGGEGFDPFLECGGPYDVGAGSAWERQSTMNSARDT